MLLKNFDIMKCVTAPEDQDIRYQETARTTRLECSRNELIPFFLRTRSDTAVSI